MDGEVTTEQARELLDALVEGGGMKHIDTPLALRLIPLADEVGRTDLALDLMNRAEAAAADDVEKGWVRLEQLRRDGSDIDTVLEIATEMEIHEKGARLAAAALHHAALLHHAKDSWEEAHALVNRSLRLRQQTGDEEGRSYGLAVRASCERAMELMTQAIETQMERLGVLERLDDQEGIMETLADLAHLHATVGEVDLASDHLNRSLELAKDMRDLSGQLVAAWGLADVSEIAEDWSNAMLHLSDVVHAFMAVGLPAPEQVRERIKALTDLADRA
ncbi:MAG TPA: hypothetical protein HA286_03675 [Candidatus Poseidoniaceae archaeon]|nr:MAG TPA: hypothetical protein D7H96_03610 [Candidatus Poseidoniales archaeon]HIH53357.1 hypothetical protein [Candidatus Poseidoniaceae archaeon]